MTRIPLLDPASAEGDASKALASSIGHLGLFRALAHAPTHILPIMRLGRAILAEQQLDPRRRELLVLLAMRLEGGAYEWAQHIEIALDAGAKQTEIDALDKLQLGGDCFDPADRALLAFAEAAIRSVRVPDPIFQVARMHFGVRELVEALVTIGFYMMLARVTEALQIEPDAPQGRVVLASSKKAAGRR